MQMSINDSLSLVTNSILQIIFKKPPSAEFWHSIKQEYLQLSSTPLSFPIWFLCVAGFHWYNSTQTFHARLNDEVDIKIQMSFFKPHIETQYVLMQSHPTHYIFCFENRSYIS